VFCRGRDSWIRHNCGDIDQRFHVGIVDSCGANDRAAIGVTQENDWCILAPQHTAQGRHVVSQRRQRELRRDDYESESLQFGGDLFQLEPSAQAPWTSTAATLFCV
jgi:hypothetical protein